MSELFTPNFWRRGAAGRRLIRQRQQHPNNADEYADEQAHRVSRTYQKVISARDVSGTAIFTATTLSMWLGRNNPKKVVAN